MSEISGIFDVKQKCGMSENLRYLCDIAKKSLFNLNHKSYNSGTIVTFVILINNNFFAIHQRYLRFTDIPTFLLLS